MSLFKQRSSQSELIDWTDIPFDDWNVCLRELDVINTCLGGHAVTIHGLQSLLDLSLPAITIAEIGCGGGDNLNAIHRWNKNKNLPIHYIGIDLNEACIAFARSNCGDMPHARFIHSDYREVTFGDQKPDIIFSSLFCHHFSDKQLVEMFRWLNINSGLGFFVNDLQRHPIAYHSISLLTRIFSRSRLIRHDAPISVLRGFRRHELERLLQMAGMSYYDIRWRWAFRYLIIVQKSTTTS